MSLKVWALKPGELKRLDRGGLVLLAVRCSLRVEPWVPPSAAKTFAYALREIAKAAFAPPLDESSISSLRRELSNLGTSACNSLNLHNDSGRTTWARSSRSTECRGGDDEQGGKAIHGRAG